MAQSKLSLMSEQELASESREGNEDALAELITRFQPFIAMIVRTCRVPASGVDDVCQDVNIAITKSILRLENPALVKSWIRGITIRQTKNYLRREGLRNAVSLNDGSKPIGVAWTFATSSTNIRRAENLQKLKECVGQLNEVKQQIVLRKLRGASNKEIARELDLSEPNVSSHWQRARARLRTCFGDNHLSTGILEEELGDE